MSHSVCFPRDDYITINWANNDGPSQYYRVLHLSCFHLYYDRLQDAWVGTDPATLGTPCRDQTNPDLDACWSGWFVDAGGQ